MKRVLLAAAAVASLSACSTLERFGLGSGGPAPMADPGMSAPMSDNPGMSGPMMPTSAMAYVRAAGESDLFEITSSQLALQRTQNPDIRAFASTMIDHHTSTTNTLLAAARAARMISPPAVLRPDKRAMIDQLNGQVGASFDRLYLRQQVMAHGEALAIHTSYAQRGDNAALRAAAAGTVPVVQGHLSTAQSLQARMGPM